MSDVAPSEASAGIQAPSPQRDTPPLVLLAGNPNAGKTTLFNALSGARARVANYPGVTVERRSARMRLGNREEIEIVDLPGTYSLCARSPEEQVAVDALLGRMGHAPRAVIAVVDANAIGRNLYLVQQIVETGVPVVVALNMMDEVRAAGLRIDTRDLGERIGAEVVEIVASKREGVDALMHALTRAISEPRTTRVPAVTWDVAVERAITHVEHALPEDAYGWRSEQRRAWALWALLSIGDDELIGVSPELRRAVEEARDAYDGDLDLAIIAKRYERIDATVAETVHASTSAKTSLTARIDSVLTHPVWGFLAFAAVMLIVFEMLFSWSEPAIGFIENRVVDMQTAVAMVLPDGPLQDLAVNGVVAGVGNVLVFIPQIALLFLFIGALEDSGYLARVAFVIDRIMSSVGLHGRAFVPLLSGFACAIPAVLATRTIESRRDRLVTMMALPLMSCSARLPVYILLIATIFAGHARVFGIVSAGAAVLLAMYLLSVGATLGAAAVLRRTVLKGPRPSFVLELPPYRLPLLRNLWSSTWQRVRAFLVDAGTIILALTIVLWALLAYPKSDAITTRYEHSRTEVARTSPAAERDERLNELEAKEASEQLANSIAGRLGKALEPALEPLGFDWRLGIGILGAFAAREVFVSTLGIVFGIGEADEASVPLRTALRDAVREDGSRLMTPLAGISLMVFFVLACQCMSTLAVVRRESGSWKWPLFMFAYMSVLAYAAAFLVYQVGRAMGWGVGA